jgi:DNA polymerase III subunit epsilon
MREIVFDTETTGLSPETGDRMVEIGCIELVNRVETGRTFHCYFNPERPMDPAAQAVHGLSDTFLANKSLFADKVEELLDFIEDSPLVAHNARFDFGFLNNELDMCSRLQVSMTRMIDTLAMSRAKHPGAKHSLDALCTRYGIDRSHRVVHGALLDAQLLAQLYIELTGGRQIGLSLVDSFQRTASSGEGNALFSAPKRGEYRAPRPHTASEEEKDRHRAFVAKLRDPLWGDMSNPVDQVLIDATE